MRHAIALTLIAIVFSFAQACAEEPEAKYYFDMDINLWKKLSHEEKEASIKSLKSLAKSTSHPQNQYENFDNALPCMEKLASSTEWSNSGTGAGALFTKCVYFSK